MDSAAMAARAEQVKNQHQRDLMTKANVVGVGIGYRTVQGQPTGEIGLVVMVSRKVPRDRLDPADLVPHDIDGVPVDVQEVGEIRAQ
jgi:hypothetical protein